MEENHGGTSPKETMCNETEESTATKTFEEHANIETTEEGRISDDDDFNDFTEFTNAPPVDEFEWHAFDATTSSQQESEGWAQFNHEQNEINEEHNFAATTSTNETNLERRTEIKRRTSSLELVYFCV